MHLLITGDSIIKKVNETLPPLLKNVKVTYRPFPGIGVGRLTAIFESKDVNCDEPVDMVYVHVGTNDLAHRSMSMFQTMFSRLFGSISRRFPGCRILVSAILPLKEGHYYDQDECEVLNCKAQEVNNFLRDMCFNNSDMFFCRKPNLFWLNKISHDGLHLKLNCGSYISELIAERALQVMKIPGPTSQIEPVLTWPLLTSQVVQYLDEDDNCDKRSYAAVLKETVATPDLMQRQVSSKSVPVKRDLGNGSVNPLDVCMNKYVPARGNLPKMQKVKKRTSMKKLTKESNLAIQLTNSFAPLEIITDVDQDVHGDVILANDLPAPSKIEERRKRRLKKRMAVASDIATANDVKEDVPHVQQAMLEDIPLVIMSSKEPAKKGKKRLEGVAAVGLEIVTANGIAFFLLTI